MEAYKKKFKFRLAWWIVWYSVCSLFFFGHLIEFIINANVHGDRYLDNYYNPKIIMKCIILILFGSITLLKFPSREKLIEKDLRKNPDDLQVKAMQLERELKNLKKCEKKKEETEDLNKKVTEMEAEIKKIKSEN